MTLHAQAIITVTRGVRESTSPRKMLPIRLYKMITMAPKPQMRI